MHAGGEGVAATLPDDLEAAQNKGDTLGAYWHKIDWRRGSFTLWARARYSWLSLAVAITGLILSVSAWFAVSHREDQLAALELSGRAESHALNLQVGIISYLRKVS